jgi:hypothetical protein
LRRRTYVAHAHDERTSINEFDLSTCLPSAITQILCLRPVKAREHRPNAWNVLAEPSRLLATSSTSEKESVNRFDTKAHESIRRARSENRVQPNGQCQHGASLPWLAWRLLLVNLRAKKQGRKLRSRMPPTLRRKTDVLHLVDWSEAFQLCVGGRSLITSISTTSTSIPKKEWRCTESVEESV